VVGSGPAGFYCAKELLRQVPNVRVDLFERFPVPFGLLRFGVAPDHPEVKNAAKTCAEVAEDPRVRWFGNVSVGAPGALDVAFLRRCYAAVVCATGAGRDRRLGIPGEDLTGVWGARDFVDWYNAMPGTQDREFKLQQVRRVVIVGMGNVALDCARLLNAPSSLLAETDCASHALTELQHSAVRHTVVLGRRGPLHAQFTIKELRELGALGTAEGVAAQDPNAWLNLVASETECAEAAAKAKAVSRPKHRLMDLLLTLAARKRIAERSLEFAFCRAPIEIRGDASGRVTGVVCAVMAPSDPAGEYVPTGVTEVVPCDLVLRSIGYRGSPIPGLPYDDRRGVLPVDGRWRVPIAEDAVGLAPVYATGWAGTGPTGVVATTIANAAACARCVAADLQDRPPEPSGIESVDSLLAHMNAVDWAGWRRIEATELARGQARGKAAEKLTDTAEMVRIARDPNDTPNPALG